ncbi:hypothetical protein HY968_04840 [Candidatus Kaiserbacteria bacterium]|nr:hypothetical protein [Candidatus Kaiserbacteria bacterium]
MKVSAKYKAIELRKAGHSYNYIAPIVGVSKSTLGVWLVNVPYEPNSETLERIGKAHVAAGQAKSLLKMASIQSAKIEAAADIGALSSRDIFMLGLGLYIGEGAKSLQETRFVNANPAIMRFIVRWFVEAIGLNKKNIRIRLHLYPDCNEEASLKFWSNVIGIPRSQFLSCSIDRRDNKKSKKIGKLPHGTAHLTTRSLGEKRFGVFLARKIAAWSDIVLGQEKRD